MTPEPQPFPDFLKIDERVLSFSQYDSADREPKTMADGPVLCREVTIHFPVGLHIRPATIIAKKARDFQTEVFLVHGDRKASTKNVFDMFLLGVEKDSQLKLEAEDGPDAQAALNALAGLFAPDHAEMHLTPDGE
jgi:phosphotransferase system HPr (HPr) family protein